MQLSLSPSPAEPNLTAQLLGNESSATASFDSDSGEHTAPFAELFPDLASASSTPPSPAIRVAPRAAAAPWIGSTGAPISSAPGSILRTHSGAPAPTTATAEEFSTITRSAFAATEVDESSAASDQSEGVSDECSDAWTSRRDERQTPCAVADPTAGMVLPFLPIAPSELIGVSFMAGSGPAPRVENALAIDSAGNASEFGSSHLPASLRASVPAIANPPGAATISRASAATHSASAKPEPAFTRPGPAAAAGFSPTTTSLRSPLVESTSGIPLSAVVVSSPGIPTAGSSPFAPEPSREARLLDLAELPAPSGHWSAVDELSTVCRPMVSAANAPLSFGEAAEVTPLKSEHISGLPFAPTVMREFAPPEVLVPSVAVYSGPPEVNAGAPMSPVARTRASLDASAALPVTPESGLAIHAPAVSAPVALTDPSPLDSASAPAYSLPLALAAREYAPISRGEKSSNTRGAKIAAPTGSLPAQQNSEQTNLDKTFLSASEEKLTSPSTEVGTGVAKTDVVMSAATLFNRPAPTAVFDHASVAPWSVSSLAGSSDFSAPSGFAPEAAATAQQAVEAVLTAAERVTSRDQQSVNLQFSVGGTDLSVRVELRANQIHATFHSDSPELNSALAHEWQGSALTHEWQGAALAHQWGPANGAEAGERSLRFAAPVFTTSSLPSDESALAGFAGGDGSSQERGAGARRGDEDSAAYARSARSSLRPASSSSTVADSVSTVVTAVSHGTRLRTSSRLQTHA